MIGSKGMYKDSPRLSRKEDGKMGVSKPESQETDAAANVPGEPVTTTHMQERHEMKNRQVQEHLQMHSRHEQDYAKSGADIGTLHPMHQKELEDMHKKHQTEMKSMHDRHVSGAANEEGEE